MKKVLIITSSLRHRSNSDALAEAFARGASEAGNEVETITLKDKEVHFCKGCLACQTTQKCVIADDAPAIVQKMYAADVIAFTTPIYYYELSGQLKTLLDRSNPLFTTDYHFRDIVDLLRPDGTPAEDGEQGQIVIHTENGKPLGLFKEYYRDAAKTREAWHDGLYYTGDVAWRDEDGYFWFVGRADDVIKSSGYRIGPFEVESALMTHPAVVECAITGVPDEIRGQVVKATIVLSKDYKDKAGEDKWSRQLSYWQKTIRTKRAKS